MPDPGIWIVGDVVPEGQQVAWRGSRCSRNSPKEAAVASLSAAGDSSGFYVDSWPGGAGPPSPSTPTPPLFLSNQGSRMSLRRVPLIFACSQGKAGFDRLYNCRALRRTAITNVYRATRDRYLAQRFARHASPLTTTAHRHPSDEELYEAIRAITG